MDTVGAYRLLRQIGEGGMGVVHLALASDGSRVAVKILRPQVIGDREARQRLEREVAAMRRVHSPRVAEFVDADPWGHPPYVVTRYVAGLSLTEYVAEFGPLDITRLHRFATGTAEALAGVHAAGVLHRDVKPSNVLINRDQPVLIDFGLAMTGDESRMTHAGWVFGTPAYLAPEVVLGDAPTPAVDVHGWAATVAFAATGRSPYGSGPSVVVLDRIRRGEYTLAGVPEPTQSILHRCLDPQPHQRPTAPELCRWLHQVAPQEASTRQVPLTSGARTLVAGPPGGSFGSGSADDHAVGDGSVGTASVAMSPPSAASMRSVGHPLGEPAAPVAGAGPTLGAPLGPTSHAGSDAGSSPGWPSQPVGAQAAPPQVAHVRAAPAWGQPSGHWSGQAPRSAGAAATDPDRLGPPAGWPAPQPSTSTRLLRWASGLAGATALAGALAIAPYVVTGLVLVLLIAIRASLATADRRRRLESRRGPRARDGFVGFVAWPLRVALAAPLAAVACAIALGAAMAISGLQTLAADMPGDAATVLGGVAFAFVLWWGPVHFTLRRVADGATRAMLTPPVAGVVTATILAACALVLLVIAHDSPTWWAPFGEAPWRWLRS